MGLARISGSLKEGHLVCGRFKAKVQGLGFFFFFFLRKWYVPGIQEFPGAIGVLSGIM